VAQCADQSVVDRPQQLPLGSEPLDAGLEQVRVAEGPTAMLTVLKDTGHLTPHTRNTRHGYTKAAYSDAAAE
jgi:hypothetical protein